MIRVLGVTMALLVFVRLIFDGLNFIPAFICIHNSRTVETCKDKNLLPQNVSNVVNTIGSYLEALSSLFLLLLLFLWSRFHVYSFFIGILKVGHFWLWFALCCTVIVTVFKVDLTETRASGQPNDLGFGLILEAVSLTLFASALNFVGRDTLRYYFIQRSTNSRWSDFLLVTYFGVLVSYFVRNFGLFLYDTALIAMSLSRASTGSQHYSSINREWDSVLLVFTCAFRECLFRFFFAKMFQGCRPPQVCNNIDEERGLVERSQL